MENNKGKLGGRGENIAVDYLLKSKYKIIQRNYRCKFGEIDIIAFKNNTYIFVEVKTRKNCSFCRPAEAIDFKKRNHLLKTAQYFTQVYHIVNCNYRFDAIEIIIMPETQINHIENIIN